MNLRRLLLITSVATGLLGGLSSVCSAACPISTTSATPTVTVPRDQWKVGNSFTVTVPTADLSAVSTVDVCFDKSESLAVDEKAVAFDAQKKTASVPIVIPVTAQRSAGLLAGDHSVAIQFSDGKSPVVVQATMAGPVPPAAAPSTKTPKLDSVKPIARNERDREFKLKLEGDNFDVATPTDPLVIRLNDTVRKTCWEDDCSKQPDALKGVVRNAREIVLSHFDPLDNTGAGIEVCFHDRCSELKADEAQSTDHYVALGGAVGITVVLAVMVGLLASVRKNQVTIWGKHYVLTTLLLDKETGTYSLSKLQFYIWTIVAVFGYTYLTLARNWIQSWHGLPPIPSTLPGIIGISAGTAVGAQVVTQMNGPKGSGSLYPGLSDLITTGDVVVPERVQFLVWTILGALGVVLVIAQLDPRVLDQLPEIPPTLLAISGISAFGYLGGKLARNAGPVINEMIVRIGPDPDVIPPVSGQATAAPAPTPAWFQRIQTAVAAVTDAQKRFAAIGPAAPATVVTPTKAAIDAATSASTAVAKLTAGATASDIGAAKISVDKLVADGAKGADDASKALEALGAAKGSDADFAATTSVAKIAQDAAKAVQDLQAALLTAVPAGPGARGSSTTFGLIELRGRMLSQDATFKISLNADVDTTDFQLTFDRLEPSPKDDKHLQKPRVLERDPDASDDTMAKRLLMVVRLDDKTSPFFIAKSTHTLTSTNPDSQKVVFKFDVPDSQRPS